MRLIYDPKTEDWSSALSCQVGGADRFIGYPYQRGAGIGAFLRGIFRYLLPIGRAAAEVVGKEGLEAAHRVLGDVIAGEKLAVAGKRSARRAAKNILQAGANSLEGGGRRKKLYALGGPPLTNRDIFGEAI
jgi:hypothetical protein